MGGIIHDFNRENELERIEKLKKKALQLEEEERSKTKKAASDLERQQPLERIEESEKNAYWKELGRIGKNKLSQQEEEETEKDTNKAHLQWEQRHIGSGHSSRKTKKAAS